MKSLKDFDPNEVAHLDLEMWKAYYSHRFVRLFFLLVRLLRKQFGLGLFTAIRAASFAAAAATDFRRNKGKEDKQRVYEKVLRFTQIVSANAPEEFNAEQAATTEVEWWFVDRYPENFLEGERERGLARAMSAIYGVNPEALADYAKYRAQAMVLQDEAEETGKEADWERMGILLRDSYRALFTALHEEDRSKFV